MTDQPKKYYVRFSNIDDHDNIMEFYKNNPHKNVSDRNEDLMRQLADHGAVTLIEDEQGKIVGSSISYPMIVSEGGIERQKWLEIGTTRMVLNGYPGLFDVMIAMQSLRAYLVEPPEDKFVCQMESPFVQKMAFKLGWRPLNPPDELVKVSDETLGSDESCGFDNWYAAGPEALPVMARLMRDALDKPCLENPKTGEKITLDLSKSRFFAMFEQEIRNLADRDLGNPDTPDVSASIAKNRQEWMRHHFK